MCHPSLLFMNLCAAHDFHSIWCVERRAETGRHTHLGRVVAALPPLYQCCTKIVETEFDVSKTYKGNYSGYVLAKAIWVETQHAA